MYKIVGVDGKQYGPVSAEQLRQWLAEGRVNAQTQVLVEGAAGWTTLSALPEFSAQLGQTAPQPFSSAQYGSAAVPKTNSMATAGMIMGILSVVFGCCCHGMPFNVLGIIFSLIALSQIKSDPHGQQGRGMAIAGLVLSIISIVFAVALLVFVGLASAWPAVIRDF